MSYDQIPPQFRETLMPLDVVKSSGVLQEANRLFFNRIGLQLVALQDGDTPLMLALQDLRRAPETAVLPRIDPQKVKNIQEALEQTAVVRQQLLGYVVQEA